MFHIDEADVDALLRQRVAEIAQIIWATCVYHCLLDFWCTCKPDNSDSLSGVLKKPWIIHVLQLIQDQQRSCHNITTFGTKISYIGVRNNYNISLQNMFK
jgi:hypothetical protein